MASKKRPRWVRGRKPRAGEAATRWLQVRITDAEHAQLERLAKAAGLPVSAYVRRAALESSAR